MTALQQVSLGTSTDGKDGDSNRAAFTKLNSNVVALQAQAALTSAASTLTTGQALTAANHLGRRVLLNLTAAGTVNLFSSASAGPDGVVLIVNVGSYVATVAIGSGSGDTIYPVAAAWAINPGEAALFHADGAHGWYGISSYNRALPVFSIGASVDFNTLTVPGDYHQASNTNAASGSNYPVAAAGLLEVRSAATMVYQTYTIYNSGIKYTRAIYGGSAGVWRTLLDSNSDILLGDTTSADGGATGVRTIQSNYRMGVARNSASYYPYIAIANSALQVASPPTSQGTLGNIAFHWGSTTSDALAGTVAADITGYANTDGSGMMGLFARDKTATAKARLYLSGSTGNVVTGTSATDIGNTFQVNGTAAVNPNLIPTWASLNQPSLRVIDGGSGSSGGVAIESYQPLIQFIDRSVGAKNSRMLMNSGIVYFASDPGDGSGVYNPPGFLINPDGCITAGGGASYSSNTTYLANGTTIGTGSSQYGFYSNQEFNAAATSYAYGFNATPKINDGGQTLGQLYGFHFGAPTIGATATVTNVMAFNASDVTATNVGGVMGYRSRVTSGTNKWNAYFDGSASNHFKGRLLLGTTTDDGANLLQVSGNARTYGSHYVGASGTVTSWLSADTNNGYFQSMGDTVVGSASGTGATRFAAGNGERARITSAGRLLLGTTTDDGSNLLQVAGSAAISGPVKPGVYTLVTLPSAAAYNSSHIMVSNATGGAKLCYSNGTNWCLVNTTTVVS